MSFERTHYLPIIIGIWFPLTFIMSYVISTQNKDVAPLFPYISDTGAFPPESCIFGQMLNLGAMLMAVISYIRYLQLRDMHENNELREIVKKLNGRSFIMALLAALGVSIVANFQEVNSLSVHLTGAVLAFGVGGVYISIQSYISFEIYPLMGSKVLNWIRVVLAAGTIIFFLSTFAFAFVAAANGKKSDSNAINTHWTPDEPGWGWHFMSTLSEWILAFCVLSYLATFAYDFKRLSMTAPTVRHKF